MGPEEGLVPVPPSHLAPGLDCYSRTGPSMQPSGRVTLSHFYADKSLQVLHLHQMFKWSLFYQPGVSVMSHCKRFYDCHVTTV